MVFRFTALYVILIVAVNYGFTVAPLVALPGGEMWPPISLLVGFIFVARDYAQREIGHRVILAMLAAGVLSYVMASPFIAVASVAAFLISEFADWAVYTFTGRTFARRVLLSSAVGTPIDSAVFLSLIDQFSMIGVLAMTASKMLGALLVWWDDPPPRDGGGIAILCRSRPPYGQRNWTTCALIPTTRTPSPGSTPTPWAWPKAPCPAVKSCSGAQTGG